jgi:hypothetical protein
MANGYAASLLNRENSLFSRELARAWTFGAAPAARFRCYSLHFGSGIEEFQSLGPDLFRAARARARGVARAAPIFCSQGHRLR